MKYLSLDVFSDFKCIGSSCPDTCCAGWDILVDQASVKYYQTVDGSFGKRLQSGLRRDGEIWSMRLTKGRCPMLTDENLCDIYIHLGEDKMCNGCQSYPRRSETYGELCFNSLNISCPEVCRRILTHKDILQFDFAEDELVAPASAKDTDWTLYNTLISSLTTSIHIIQSRELSLSERMRLLVLFNDALQIHLEDGSDCSQLFDAFVPENLIQYKSILSRMPSNHRAKLSFLINMGKHSETFKNLASYNPYWANVLDYLCTRSTLWDDSEFDVMINSFLDTQETIPYEQYCVYYLFYYYMGAYHDRQPMKRIAILAYLYCIHLCSSALYVATKNTILTTDTQIELFVKTARFFEHSHNDWRLESLYKMSQSSNMAETSFLLSLLA